MNNDVAVVHQYPSGLADTLTMQRRRAFFVERVEEGIRDGPDLALASGCTDDEVVGNGCQVADIEQDDIVSQLVCGNINDPVRKLR